MPKKRGKELPAQDSIVAYRDVATPVRIDANNFEIAKFKSSFCANIKRIINQIGFFTASVLGPGFSKSLPAKKFSGEIRRRKWEVSGSIKYLYFIHPDFELKITDGRKITGAFFANSRLCARILI